MVCGLSLFFCTELSAASSEELIDEYIQAFSPGASEQMQLDALNELQWSGISDTRVYDLVEQNLLDIYLSARSRSKELDLVSWYAKSLGTSGLDKYRQTLKQVLDSKVNKKVSKYAQEGLDNLSKYAVWNPIISGKENARPDKPHFVNAYANMLRSKNWELMNMAAKRIWAEEVRDRYLLQVLDEVILRQYQASYSEKIHILTLAWMTRALASSSDPEYKATVEAVANNAGTRKVRSYASKYLRQYY